MMNLVELISEAVVFIMVAWPRRGPGEGLPPKFYWT